MAVGKEIRGKIKSVENTKKITKAMEMVAASKMRKAQERMRSARPYADKIRNITANLSQANPEYRSPYQRTGNTSKAVGFIVVTTDKGLCGGLNTNVLRAITTKMREVQQAGGSIQVVAIGNKGFGFMNRLGAAVVSHAIQLGDAPQLDKLIGPVKVMLDAFVEGKLDAVHLCYTKFINTMRQEPTVEQLPAVVGRAPAAKRRREKPVRLGLHLRARCADRHQRPADALHRSAGLPGRGREHGQRAERAHGGDESRHRQRRQPDRRAQAHLQQDPASRDHQGTVRDRRRRCRG
jgi:ATP synthase F1 gamma subunit